MRWLAWRQHWKAWTGSGCGTTKRCQLHVHVHDATPACDVRLLGRSVRVRHRYKEAWANPTSWHVDVPYWSFNSLSAVSFWLALDDADLSNGCLHFLPGSHKELQKQADPYTEVKIGKNMRDVFDMYVHPGAVPWCS